jgi:hypothetical protein
VAAQIIAAVPTGTTGTIDLTFSGSSRWCSIASYSLTRIASSIPYDTASASAPLAAVALNTVISRTNGGVVIGCSASGNDAGNSVWGGLTVEDYDTALDADRVSSAHLLSAADTDLAVTFSDLEPPDGNEAIFLTSWAESVAGSAAFVLSGQAALFLATLAAASASYTLIGQGAAFVGRLTAAARSYAETGQGALFSLDYRVAVGTLALSGNAAALRPTAIAGAGSQALTGVAATFTDTLAADARSYTISWQTFSDASTLAANGAAVSLTGQGANLSYDIDLGGVGSSFSGGTFSRGRWRELKELERQAREAAELARRRIEDEVREAARRRAAEQRAAIAAARAAKDRANAARAQAQAGADALAALSGAQSLSQAMRAGDMMNEAAAAAHAQQLAAEQEEEEAIVHLLLMSA